jgi:hypothetical protein
VVSGCFCIIVEEKPQALVLKDTNFWEYVDEMAGIRVNAGQILLPVFFFLISAAGRWAMI